MSAGGLRFTSSGAVAAPEALQLRLGAAFHGRLAVGAPEPQRSMRTEEVEDNISYFTRGGPRDRPVHTVVLSGLDPSREVLAGLVGSWRARGVQRLVVHLGVAGQHDLQALTELADEVVVIVRAASDLDGAGVDGRSVTVELNSGVMASLPELIRRLDAVRPRRVVLTWPFPSAEVGTPPPATDVVRALDAAGLLQRPDLFVKGLPPCTLAHSSLGAMPLRVRRTSNRWYVDADHQRQEALIFFPDLVRFARPDSCRFCRVADRCDGVAEAWLTQGLAGPLVPL